MKVPDKFLKILCTVKLFLRPVFFFHFHFSIGFFWLLMIRADGFEIHPQSWKENYRWVKISVQNIKFDYLLLYFFTFFLMNNFLLFESSFQVLKGNFLVRTIGSFLPKKRFIYIFNEKLNYFQGTVQKKDNINEMDHF